MRLSVQAQFRGFAPCPRVIDSSLCRSIAHQFAQRQGAVVSHQHLAIGAHYRRPLVYGSAFRPCQVHVVRCQVELDFLALIPSGFFQVHPVLSVAVFGLNIRQVHRHQRPAPFEHLMPARILRLPFSARLHRRPVEIQSLRGSFLVPRLQPGNVPAICGSLPLAELNAKLLRPRFHRGNGPRQRRVRRQPRGFAGQIPGNPVNGLVHRFRDGPPVFARERHAQDLVPLLIIVERVKSVVDSPSGPDHLRRGGPRNVFGLPAGNGARRGFIESVFLHGGFGQRIDGDRVGELLMQQRFHEFRTRFPPAHFPRKRLGQRVPVDHQLAVHHADAAGALGALFVQRAHAGNAELSKVIGIRLIDFAKDAFDLGWFHRRPFLSAAIFRAGLDRAHLKVGDGVVIVAHQSAGHVFRGRFIRGLYDHGMTLRLRVGVGVVDVV